MRRLHVAAYAVVGSLSILGGVTGVLFPIAPSPTETHLLRELGAMGVFVGLMSLWCSLNYERRRWIHNSFILLTSLLAAIHWHEWVLGNRELLSPVVNSLPLAGLLLMSLTAPATDPPSGP